jgi:hypothetical protein
MMNNDASASLNFVVEENSLFLTPSLIGFGDRFFNRCGQTPRRGDRLIGLATAAKKERSK